GRYFGEYTNLPDLLVLKIVIQSQIEGAFAAPFCIFRSHYMGKKSGKNEPAKVDPVYVLGLDANGKPRGARFGELKDSICSAAMDMNCRVLIDQPAAVSALGMKLPVGRVHGGGKVVKLFVPNIRRELYDQILEAARIAAEQSEAEVRAGGAEQSAAVTAQKDQADA